MANFPNGAYTLPKGRLYIENSPVGFYGASKNSPRIYQWQFLTRYGLTDNLEFRIFSNGLTAQAQHGKQPATTGFSPLALDLKANFWEENTRYHIPAVGLEVYLQTIWGSPAFSGGTQPSMNLLFDQSLPLAIGFEWNVGITGVQNASGQVVYEFSFQWSFQARGGEGLRRVRPRLLQRRRPAQPPKRPGIRRTFASHGHGPRSGWYLDHQ